LSWPQSTRSDQCFERRRPHRSAGDLSPCADLSLHPFNAHVNEQSNDASVIQTLRSHFRVDVLTKLDNLTLCRHRGGVLQGHFSRTLNYPQDRHDSIDISLRLPIAARDLHTKVTNVFTVMHLGEQFRDCSAVILCLGTDATGGTDIQDDTFQQFGSREVKLLLVRWGGNMYDRRDSGPECECCSFERDGQCFLESGPAYKENVGRCTIRILADLQPSNERLVWPGDYAHVTFRWQEIFADVEAELGRKSEEAAGLRYPAVRRARSQIRSWRHYQHGRVVDPE
jgi:hypothetical protein